MQDSTQMQKTIGIAPDDINKAGTKTALLKGVLKFKSSLDIEISKVTKRTLII